VFDVYDSFHELYSLPLMRYAYKLARSLGCSSLSTMNGGPRRNFGGGAPRTAMSDSLCPIKSELLHINNHNFASFWGLGAAYAN